MTTIKELKNGEFFTVIPYNEKEVKETNIWIKGPYDRTEKKYLCYKFSNVNYFRYFKGCMTVYTDFIF